MLVDLHVHTNLSDDSRTAAAEYLAASVERGRALGAICFTEHRLFPRDANLDRTYDGLSQRYGILIIKGVEVDSNLGHLLLYGLTDEVIRRFDPETRMHNAQPLIELVHGEGGVAIPAHPFRDSGYGIRLEELVAKLGGSLSVIEAVNGQNSPEQNERAMIAAQKLGLTAVAGSDAHFSNPDWFLTCATKLEREIKSVEELCAELRNGRAAPYWFPELRS